MAILYSRNEMYTVIAQLFVEILNELCAFLCAEVSAVMVLNLPVVNGNDVATDGKIVRAHLITDGCSLQRSTSLINLI